MYTMPFRSGTSRITITIVLAIGSLVAAADVGAQIEESVLTFEAIDAENQLLWCSDWPHWDFDVPSVIWDLPFLDERKKRKILGENAAELFGLDNPYAAKQAAE